MTPINDEIVASGASQREPGKSIPYFETLTLAAISIEGILALALGLSLPSEQESAVFLGYSPARLILLSAALVGVFVPAILALQAIASPGWFNRRRADVQMWLEEPDRAFWILYVTLVAAGVSIVTVIFYFIFGSYFGSSETAILQRAWPFIAWLGLALIHVFSLVARMAREALDRNRDLQHSRLTFSVVVLFVAVLSYAHWLTLRFSLPVFTSIPDWYWTPLTWYGFNTHLYLPMIAVATGTVYLLIRHEWRPRITLPLFMGLAVLLQFSVGFVRGTGLESLRQHHLTLGQSVYAEYISDDNASISDILRYDEKFEKDFYLGTKPPGYLLLYFLTQAASDFIAQTSTFHERHRSVTDAITIFFPIVASLAVLPIYSIARIFTTPRVGRIACALYVTAPSFILMALRLDQVLFPVLFATGLLLVVITFRSRSAWLSFAAGAFAYISIFVSFSLIPLLVMSVAYLLIAQVRATGHVRPIAQFRLVYYFIFGVALAAVLLAVFLKFDVISRYTSAIALHRRVMGTTSPGLGTLSDLPLNNIEFASWIGSGLAILSVAGILIVVCMSDRREALSFRPFAFAGGVAWLLLNLFGQTRGETGRLWLFFLPFVVLLAAQAVHAPKLRIPKLLALIVACQTGTTWLILQFQFAA